VTVFGTTYLRASNEEDTTQILPQNVKKKFHAFKSERIAYLLGKDYIKVIPESAV
jgi:hypothetical protein